MNKQSQSGCDIEVLHQAVAGNLDADSQSHLEAHLSACESCQSRIEGIASNEEDWNVVRQSLSDVEINAVNTVDGPRSDVHCIVEPTEEQSSNFEPFLDQPSHPETLGAIDGFEVEQLIGRGGMGVVYRGFDKELNRPVAIKFLAPHLAANGVARKRFAREAQAAAAVVHPNVVPIHSVSSSPDRPYLVMALVAGRSLQKYVEDFGPLPLMDIVRISHQIAAGLAAAHEQGLVHRDIKPANILLEKDVSRVMITDFGLARAADDAALTQSGWLAGTPHYMSPEQAMGDPIDHRSDLFSLGSVMFFMATGREPFRAEKSWAVLQKIGTVSPNSIRSINNRIPKPLEQIVEALMHKKPSRRVQSATEANELLTDYLAHLQNPTVVRKPKPPCKPKVEQRSKLLPLLGCLALASLCWLAYFFPPGSYFAPSKTHSFKPQVGTINIEHAMATPSKASVHAQALLQDNQFEQELAELENAMSGLESNRVPNLSQGTDQFQIEMEAAESALRQLELNFSN